MTIQNTTIRKAGPSLGNGVTTVFPFTFKVFTATDILVTYLNALAVESVLVLSTNYTVSLNADQNTSPGGSVTLLVAPATATYITLTSQVTNTQTLALTNSGGFYPESINNALDRTVIEIQQLAEQASRSITIPKSSTASPLLPTPAANNVLVWNNAATALINLPATTGASLVNLTASTGSTLVGTTNGGTGSVSRTIASKLNDVVSVKDFGAVGDGVADDYQALQAAALAAQGKSLYIPSGTYMLLTGSIQIFSNTTVWGDGEGRTIIIQPNYYSYNRPSVPYVAANVVDWNGFWMDINTRNVIISDLEIRGPFYKSSSAGYIATPVQSWPASNGIFARGRDYQVRKGLSPTGESFNIVIKQVWVEGFAEDAIQIDNATNVWITNCTLTYCARGGVRFYGASTAWASNNNISYLLPGDYLNNGNRMYGVTFTRVYGGNLADYRPSTYCTADNNKINNIPYWKGLDTHGGVNIDFVNNQILNCHIAIGVDKGGFTTIHGIAPPSNIKIIGNTAIRTLPDNPLEGDNGQCGPALQIYANDQTDEQVGRQLVVQGNIISGWGPDDYHGACVYSDWIGVTHNGNTITNSMRSAVCLRERFEGAVGGDVIDGVRQSTALVQIGYDVESDNCTGKLGDAVFINEQTTTLTGIYLANPAANCGFIVSSGHKFIQKSTGTIIKVSNPNNDQTGPWAMRLLAAGRVLGVGSISGSRGISSVSKTATGTYLIALNDTTVATASLWPIASYNLGSNARVVSASSTSTSTVTVYVRDIAGTLIDDAFIFHVFGY